MSNVVVKQGTPSAPGTVVDTSKAKVVPPSDEVTAEHAKEAEFMARTHAAGVAERNKKAKAAAKPAVKGKAKPKAAKPRSTGNGSGPSVRITAEWLSTKKRDVLVKDEVTTADGATLTVIGRWTRRVKDGSLTPMVTGRIVSGAPDGKKKGDRLNAAAKDCTHVAKK